MAATDHPKKIKFIASVYCLCDIHLFLCPSIRNMSAYEVSSSQAVLSPQRSKRVKENTPPRCAVLQNGSASNCPPLQGCGGSGWGAGEAEQASSTTRDHQHQHHVPRQTIIIPDTPSPAVSIITISSDTDEEEDHKQNNRSVQDVDTHTDDNCENTVPTGPRI